MPNEPKDCAICGATPALRYVKKRGFCKDHIPEAFDEAQIDLQYRRSQRAVEELRLDTSAVRRNYKAFRRDNFTPTFHG